MPKLPISAGRVVCLGLEARPLYPTVGRLVRFSLPAMLAGMTVPLMGLIDVAVLGRLGDAAVIAAVGVAGTIFTTIAWSFSFLRFTTTGLVSQASGRDDEAGVVVEGLRPLVAALIGGAGLLLLREPLLALGLALIAPEPDVAAHAGTYFRLRMFGAPLTLSLYAMQAWLMGVGRPRTLLATQSLMTGLNVLLTAYLVLVQGLGIAGAAIGTVTAEAVTVLVIAAVALRHVPLARWRAGTGRVFEAAAWRRLVAANTDLVVRTVLLSLSLALLNERSARLGTEVLAANQLLLQSYLLVATLIDGVALGVEVYAGRAVGARATAALRHVVSKGARMALLWGVVVAALVAAGGGVFLPLMTTNEDVVALARSYWGWQVLMPFVAVWAFLWDGVYFGAVRTRALRNSMIVSTAVYVVSSFALFALLGNHGLWLALAIQLGARAVTLTAAWPGLVRSVEESPVAVPT